MEKQAHSGRSSKSPTMSLGAAAKQFPGNQNKTELDGTDTNQESLKDRSSTHFNTPPKHATKISSPGPSSVQSVSNNSIGTDSISEHIFIESSGSDVTHLNSENDRETDKEISLETSKKSNTDKPEIKHTPHSDNSLSLDVSKLDDVHISNESSIQTPHDSMECSSLHERKDPMPKSPSPATATNNEDNQESITYSDSLIDIIPKDKVVLQGEKKSVIKDSSSSSEEMIKLDIRGKAQQTYPPKYIFGPPQNVGVFPTLGRLSDVPIFPQLIASSFGLLRRDRMDENTQDNVISEIINNTEDPLTMNQDIFSKIEIDEQQDIEMFYDSINEAPVKDEEKDCLVEELTVSNTKDNLGDTAQGRSLNPELETSSFTTYTDYRTLCEDYQQQLVHFEEAVARRDKQILELKQTLQKSLQHGEELQSRNQHLEQELSTLQQMSHDRNDILKDQLSDFIKYENMTKVEDSTKYFSVIHSTDNLSQNCSLNDKKDVDREEISIDRSKDHLDRLEDLNLNNSLTTIVREFVKTFSNTEINAECSEELKERIMHSNEVKYLEQNMNIKHYKVVEGLRKYFEKKCRDIGKNYSEEFSQPSGRRSSAASLGDSGDDYPEPFLPDSPLRSSNLHTKTDLSDLHEECESRLAALRKDCSQKLEQLKTEQLSYVSELQTRHSVMEQSYADEIRRLKADLQTLQNTDHYTSAHTLYTEDTDLELEKGVQVGSLEDVLHEAKRKLLAEVQEQLQALLSDPDADLTASPLDLIALRAKIHTEAQQKLQDMKVIHEEELSSLRAEHEQHLARVAEEGGAGDSAIPDAGGDVWRRRRNDSFDKNRRLQDITKERDGLKQKSNTLQKFVTSLVNYFAVCEEELNSTVLDELVRQVGADNLTLDITGSNSPEDFDSKNSSFNNSTEMIIRQQTDVNYNSRQHPFSGTKSKRVHFAPNVRAFLSQLEEQDQFDLSAKFDNELELSQKRLRQEAEELLALCMRVSGVRNSHGTGKRQTLDAATKIETEETIKKLVENIDSSRRDCDKARLDRKTLEKTLAESVQSEAMLKRELQEARDVIAKLLSEDELRDRGEVVTEGYGLGPSPRVGAASSLPPPCRVPHKPAPPSPESRSASLDGSGAEERRAEHARQEIEALTRDRDDLNLQLEAAKRKLRSIQGFLEQQTTEREHERDDFEGRITELRDENDRLCLRAKQNEEIMTQVELLEINMKQMTNQITNLESTKSKYEDDLKSAAEKVRDLRDIIADLETQLETKLQSEARLIQELEEMQNQTEVKDARMKRLLEELEMLKTEQESRVEEAEEERKKNADVSGIEEVQVLTQMREQLTTLEDSISKRTVTLERIHEAICSQSCSSPSEDISIRDYKRRDISECVAGPQQFPSGRDVSASAEQERHPALLPLASLARLQEHLQHHFRAEDAALKRIRDLEMQLTQLKDVAQELRAERDVLQERMSEQALKISSLQSRLEQQRHCADALRQESTGQLNLRLQDALAELRDANDLVVAKDKQILRLKALQDGNKERLDRTTDDSSPGRDRICKLEQELADAQDRNLELCRLAEELAAAEADRDRDLQLLKRQLIEKEEQMQGFLALRLDEENQKEQENYNEGAKNSARTLSDIVSFSDYDEHDLQMRRAEVQPLSANLSATNVNHLHRSHDIEETLPPHHKDNKLEMSSLKIEHPSPVIDHNTQSLPFFTTPDAAENILAKNKMNMNETIMFGSSVGKIDLHDSIKHSTAHAINDNSMYPNQEVSDDKDVSVEPKRINFSVSNNTEESLKEKSKAYDASKVKSLKELGFVIDINNENYEDIIIAQFKCEIVALRRELDEKKETLTAAEQQLVEFPKVKKEIEELKNMLQSTVQTVEQDKLFYNEQLENLSGSKRNLEQQLADVLSQANEKTKDLQLLKEDILRRENMVLELVKEKRNVQAQLSELDIKYQALENRNRTLEAYEEENVQLREKLEELQKLEQLVSEKNLQIDSLYEHLDRLDDLQRCLSDKNDEIERLNYSMEDKLQQISTLEEEVSTLREGTDNLKDENDALKSDNAKLLQEQTKLQKEQENLLKQNQHLESKLQEMDKTTCLNEELVGKLEELKILREQLKDKQYEIDILNEDMQSFHEEIASLEDQLKASRSPSPRVSARSSEDRMLPEERRTVNYKKELVKIRKQVSMLQAELKYNKKELNEKVFELERIKLEVMELKNDLGRSKQTMTDKDLGMAQLQRDKEQLTQQLHEVRERLGEESQLEELRCKLHNKTQECNELQREMLLLQDVIERLRSSSPPRSGRLAIMAPDYDSPVRRSPTRDLEERVRRELQYSRQLDDSICDQILSAAEDEASHEDVPPLILQVSQSNSSMHSSLTDKLSRISDDNEKLRSHASSLEARLQDKEALVEELKRARDAAERDTRQAQLLAQDERDNALQLKLLLDKEKHNTDDLQVKDTNVIQILSRRLESAIESEAEVHRKLESERRASVQLQRQLEMLQAAVGTQPTSPVHKENVEMLKMEVENQLAAKERLKSELLLLKAKYEREKCLTSDLMSNLEKEKRWFQTEIESRDVTCCDLRADLADLRRARHDAGLELARALDTLHLQRNDIAALEKRLAGLTETNRAVGDNKPFQSVLAEFEQQKLEMIKEIRALKKSLDVAGQREANLHRLLRATDTHGQLGQHQPTQRNQMMDRIRQLEAQLHARNSVEDNERAARFLHARCMGLESHRKALVFQKQYLLKMLHGYNELDLKYRDLDQTNRQGKRRFKCVVWAVCASLRLRFLVRRRHTTKKYSADQLFNRHKGSRPHKRDQRKSASEENGAAPNSPPSRDAPLGPTKGSSLSLFIRTGSVCDQLTNASKIARAKRQLGTSASRRRLLMGAPESAASSSRATGLERCRVKDFAIPVERTPGGTVRVIDVPVVPLTHTPGGHARRMATPSDPNDFWNVEEDTDGGAPTTAERGAGSARLLEAEISALLDSGSEDDVTDDEEWALQSRVINNAVLMSDQGEDVESETAELMSVVSGIQDVADEEIMSSAAEGSSFTWSSDYSNFVGSQEVFTGSPGPTTPCDTPYENFCQIWSPDIMHTIAEETNRYAWQTITTMTEGQSLSERSRINNWVDTNVDELYVLFAVFMFMAIDPRSRLEEYWMKNSVLEMARFRNLMSYNRYVLLTKFLHFVDNYSVAQHGSDRKVAKIQPIIDYLNSKFQSCYVPKQFISVDESLLLWKGHLSWIQNIMTKAARFGLKTYELCESDTGYLWKFRVYTGKTSDVSSKYTGLNPDLTGKTSAIVLDMVEDLHHKGYCLTMDNFYNSPALARHLKTLGIDCIGTLRISRKNVPDDLKNINVKTMAKGDIVSRHCGDVSVQSWKDAKLVTTISTYHGEGTYMGKRGNKPQIKPLVIKDYNRAMGGVDLKDQKLSLYPVERKKTHKWYQKLFRRLLNASILNALVMHHYTKVSKGQKPLAHRKFRHDLANQLLDKHHFVPEIRTTPISISAVDLRLDDKGHVMFTLMNMCASCQCLDEQMRDCDKCKTCKYVRRRCARCSALGKDIRTKFCCRKCDKSLCVGRCFLEYHSVNDLSKRYTQG